MSGLATFHPRAHENGNIRSYNTCGDNTWNWLWAGTLEDDYRESVAICLLIL